MQNEFHAKDAKAWRGWLKKNHETATEVWLVFYKKHTGHPCPTYNEAVEEALCWGWVDGMKKGLDDKRYAFRFSPRKDKSKWSPSNIKRATRLTQEGRMQPSGLKLVEAAKASGAWDSPVVPPSYKMPDAFRRALEKDPAAKDFFEHLAPSHKKQYVAWIASAKREETRERRVEKALSMLHARQKLGMV